MPKILRIINRFNLGGPTYNVAYLTQYLPSNYQTTLVGGPQEATEGSSLHITEQLQVNPLIIPHLNREIHLVNDYKAYKTLKQLIRELKPDIVHTHASKAGAVGRLAAIHAGVPVIVHTFHGHVFHSYFGKAKTAFYKWIERYLAKRSTAIIAISPIQKNELTQVYKICTPQQTHVIPLGFNLTRFTEQLDEKRQVFRHYYNLQPHEIAIGIIGRLAPVKNHQLFIDAIAYAQKKTSKTIRAFIIGDGELKETLCAYLSQHQLPYSEKEKHIPALFTFTGWETEVDKVLAGLDVVALSSKNEGTPVSLIEAQAAGKYVISTNVGGVADILDPQHGKIIEPNDPIGYCLALLDSIENFDTYSASALNARQSIIQKFSYQRLVNDMDKLYQALLKK